MSFAYKVLGQSIPAQDTVTTLYTVPAGKEAIISSITICNQHTLDPTEFSIAIVPSGQTIGNKHYLFKGKLIKHRDTKNEAIGAGLAAGDVVKISSASGTVSFSVFGTEYTAPV